MKLCQTQSLLTIDYLSCQLLLEQQQQQQPLGQQARKNTFSFLDSRVKSWMCSCRCIKRWALCYWYLFTALPLRWNWLVQYSRSMSTARPWRGRWTRTSEWVRKWIWVTDRNISTTSRVYGEGFLKEKISNEALLWYMDKLITSQCDVDCWNVPDDLQVIFFSIPSSLTRLSEVFDQLGS